MVVRMHLNETPFPPTPLVEEYLRKYASMLNRYSDEDLTNELLDELAEYVDVNRGYLSIYPSSSAILLTLLRYARKKGLRFVMLRPGFHAMYEFAKIEDVGIENLDLKLPDFTIDKSEVIERVDKSTVLYVSNPNNPTSNLLLTNRDRDFVVELCGRAHTVVMDEAYYEFSGITFTELVASGECRNLVIVRTFSKAFALAGARIGYLIGYPELVRELDGLRTLYEVPIPSLAAALAALRDLDYMKKIVAKVIELRNNLAEKLRHDLGLRVLPSATNFLFVEMPVEAKIVAEKLRERGFLTTVFKDPMIKKFLRVSVATEEDNSKFVDELKNVLRKIEERSAT